MIHAAVDVLSGQSIVGITKQKDQPHAQPPARNYVIMASAAARTTLFAADRMDGRRSAQRCLAAQDLHEKNSSSSVPVNSHGFGPMLRVVSTRLRDTGESPSSLMNLCISSTFLLEMASQGDCCT